LDLVLKVWGYFRMAVFYLTYAALAVGALRWREKTGDRNPQPGVWLTVSVILMIAKIILGKSLTVGQSLDRVGLPFQFGIGGFPSGRFLRMARRRDSGVAFRTRRGCSRPGRALGGGSRERDV
jgi:hypothetical protein